VTLKDSNPRCFILCVNHSDATSIQKLSEGGYVRELKYTNEKLTVAPDQQATEKVNDGSRRGVTIDPADISIKQSNQTSSNLLLHHHQIQLIVNNQNGNSNNNNNEFIAGKLMIGIGLLIFALFFLKELILSLKIFF